MLQIDNKIVSMDIAEKKFICDVSKCKGACCIQGDAGAPLEEDEVKTLEKVYPLVKPYMRPEAIEVTEREGLYYVDEEGDTVTMLVNGNECAYTFFENGVAKCAIEKAYHDKKIKFRKPVSCHLYPIRVKKYSDFDAVNYDIWDLCDAARTLGEKEDVPVFRFVKDALVRKYGKDFYKKLEVAHDQYVKDKNEVK